MNPGNRVDVVYHEFSVSRQEQIDSSHTFALEDVEGAQGERLSLSLLIRRNLCRKVQTSTMLVDVLDVVRVKTIGILDDNFTGEGDSGRTTARSPSTWDAPGTRSSGRDAPQSGCILAWRDAIKAAVLSTELRRAVVAHREADCRDILLL